MAVLPLKSVGWVAAAVKDSIIFVRRLVDVEEPAAIEKQLAALAVTRLVLTILKLFKQNLWVHLAEGICITTAAIDNIRTTRKFMAIVVNIGKGDIVSNFSTFSTKFLVSN